MALPNVLHPLNVVITIKGSKLYAPIVIEDIEWETTRHGSPGKLTFTVIKDQIIAFEEGNEVKMQVNGTDVFFGYVFTKARDKEHHIKVTAYDQLRYLKNKDIYQYENWTASKVITSIANDYPGFRLGTIEDTKFVIPYRNEDNKTLFDIIQTALDITTINTNQLFVLYDDVGKITLKNIGNMKLETVIDASTAENFDYSTTIDNESYNAIKLVYETKNEQGDVLRDVLKPFPKDVKHIKQWGYLQYFEVVKDEVNLKEMGERLLKQYNLKHRSLKVTGALGDLKVRAGCLVPVILNLGDIINKSYLLVDSVKHKFENGHHSMDLTLVGGDGFVK